MPRNCFVSPRGVAFVSTHPLRLVLSQSLRPAVPTLVRPLSNKQMTCKLIFWTDASFCINLILGTGIRFASVSCLSRLSARPFGNCVQVVLLGFYNCRSPASYSWFASKITVTVLVPLRHHVPTEIWLGNLNRCEKVTIREKCVDCTPAFDEISIFA